MNQNPAQKNDVFTLGPLWVKQLTKEVKGTRDVAARNLLSIRPDGDYAKQHRILLAVANAMLAGPELLAALQAILPDAEANHIGGPDTQARIEAARAAIAKATGEFDDGNQR